MGFFWIQSEARPDIIAARGHFGLPLEASNAGLEHSVKIDRRDLDVEGKRS